MTGELPLTVHVPAEEWAYAQRRLTWLETLLLRVVRDRGRMQEWYDAAELAALRLPGLPPSRTGIAQKAGREGWPRQDRARRRIAFHVSALPARAFDALVARMLDLPPLDPDPAELFGLPAAPVPETPLPPNAAPSWVLPLMRILRGEAQGDLASAWRALPAHLPAGTALPDAEEAAKVLVALGLV